MIKVIAKKALRGANIYSYRPAIVMTIDLGEFADIATNKLEGFVDVPWVPLGDYYYIHKLSETAAAYRGVKWEPYTK